MMRNHISAVPKSSHINEKTYIPMNILAYNINYAEGDRLKSFIRVVEETNCDVCFVQNVSKRSQEELFRKFRDFGYSRKSIKTASDFLFSKFEITHSSTQFFTNTKEKRYYTRYTICPSENTNRQIEIFAAQLENETPNRIKQIKEIQNIYKKCVYPIIFMGDTKILSYQKHIEMPWNDTWFEEGDNSNKYTIDSDNNILAQESGGMDRPDRICYTPGLTSDFSIQCTNFNLIKHGEDLCISDHYGVSAEFEILLH